MKKFMTVLLVIAVMFTFSFSTAFAVASVEDATLVKAASAYAQSKIAETIEQAYKAVLGATTNNVDYITEAAWEAASADIVEAVQEIMQDVEEKYLAGTYTLTDEMKAYPNDMNYTASKIFSDTLKSYVDWAKDLNADGNKYAIMAAAEQFQIDYAKAIAVYDAIDFDALYSKTAPTSTNSYYKQAKDAVTANKEALNERYFAEDGTFDFTFASVSAAKNEINNGVKYWIENGFAGNADLDKIVAVKNVKWEGTSVVKYYYVDGITTLEEVAANEATLAATTAAIKAQVAKNVAAYLLETKATTAAKNYTSDYAVVYNYLAEQLPANAKLSSDVVAHEAIMGVVYGSHAAALEAAVDGIADLEAAAAKYAAEKDAEGALVRDAAAVEKIVAKAKLAVYAKTVGITDAKIADANYDAADAAADIAALSIDTAAAKLAFDKEHKKVELAAALKTDLTKYYDLEDEAVKAAYAVATAAVDAATKTADFADIDDDLADALAKIKTSTQVDALFASGKMATELATQTSALKAYVTYVNSPIAGKTYEDAFVKVATDKEDDLLKAYYIKNNVRTIDEMKALTGAVEAVAAELPTTAEITAAEKAATAAIKAIPATVTSAAKEAVIAADNAIDALDKVYARGGFAVSELTVATQATTLDSKLTADYYLAFAKATKTDKAALKALQAEIAALNTELAAIGDATVKVEVPELAEALKAIRATEKAAVEKAIYAIPFNVTEADKATVEAARALYEAYVAEYTNYEIARVEAGSLEDGYVADDINIVELVEAETVLGLNDFSAEREEAAKAAAIADIEGLKIKANSSAKKGSITVKWTVSEEVEGVKYQVYKSTKAQKGYKKSITTSKTSFKNTKNLKKGTRYFYKVRAIAEIDGVTYYSDWSNKANRIAK